MLRTIVTRRGVTPRLLVGARLGFLAPAKGGEASISSGSEVRLENLRYTCTLPPETFCPAKNVEVKEAAAELAFSITDKSAPIVITADVASPK